MTPVILFDGRTIRMIKTVFGTDKPFVVVAKNPIIDSMGHRVTVASASGAMTFPRVLGLEVGQVLYLGTDEEVYEWRKDMEMEFPSVSDNQNSSQAFVLRNVTENLQ